jgi:PAS domain S-box-containing protein
MLEDLKLEQKLQQSEALFKNFFNLPLVGTAITSVEKGWIAVNDQTCQILGYTREELFHKNWAELTHPDDLEKDVALFKRMLAGEIDSYSIEKRFIRSDGRVVPTILSGGRSRAEGGSSEYFYVQILDITERKKYEEELIAARNAAETARQSLQLVNEELKRLSAEQIQQSRLQEREQLLQDVHDGFGSQLASVRLMVERGRIPPNELSEYLQELSADLHLVVDTLTHDGITLEEAIYDMRYRTEKRFAGRGIEFYWSMDVAAMPALSSRTILQILRIVQEATHNAIRHAEPHALRLTVRYDPDTDQLTVGLADDGKGMPVEPRHGRGLKNMQQRAREIGGSFTLVNAQPGTLVEIKIEQLTSKVSRGV